MARAPLVGWINDLKKARKAVPASALRIPALSSMIYAPASHSICTPRVRTEGATIRTPCTKSLKVPGAFCETYWAKSARYEKVSLASSLVFRDRSKPVASLTKSSARSLTGTSAAMAARTNGRRLPSIAVIETSARAKALAAFIMVAGSNMDSRVSSRAMSLILRICSGLKSGLAADNLFVARENL